MRIADSIMLALGMLASCAQQTPIVSVTDVPAPDPPARWATPAPKYAPPPASPLGKRLDELRDAVRSVQDRLPTRP